MNPYTEDQLIEQPALALLAEMEWETMDCFHEFEGSGGSPLGREHRGEVVLTKRLREALEKLNPAAPKDAIDSAIEELTRSRAVMSQIEANREIDGLLKDGVKVTVSDPDGLGERVEVLEVIDWGNPERNDFFVASQFWVAGEMYTRRPDLVGFINGLPLVLMEFKRIDVSLYSAYHDNLRDYKDTIGHLFWYNALIILSNGSESRVGSLTASWEHFAEWKRIAREDEPPSVSLETILRGVCDHQRLLDIIENFILFSEVQGGLIKILSKNHQYLGVNNTIEALKQLELNHGKLGVFWHTQGSGKSISMIFFAQKTLRKLQGNWTFVIVTDRAALDDQIYKNFASSHGVIAQEEVHAERIEHLRQLLREDHRYIFTLIHKFGTRGGEPHPVLSEQSSIIVITDEAHRSQYDTLALNMRTALPNAAFIAFTGTPLIVGEEKTKAVFGDYVSIYDFKQSVEDGATVPLYYENRVPKLQLTNEQFNEDLEGILESAELDDAQEAKIEREFAREYHLITRDDRLETIAEDIVSHFMGRGDLQGKAMVISIDKATAVKMYDKVQKYWQQYLDRLKSELANRGESGADKVSGAKLPSTENLAAKIRYMEETDMAVVVSQSQNEISDLRQKGVDIRPHRQRMVTEDLDTKFKDPDDPFRIVFVCAMWITGFDVPSCSTIYLDKPQRNHTLMQTIARANRVFGDKVNGLIVDYIGVFRDLEKALSIYAAGDNEEGRRPIQDKSKLVEKLKAAISEIREFCTNLGVDLTQIEAAEPLQRISRLNDAQNCLLINDPTKRDYQKLAATVAKLFKAILPDQAANDFVSICSLIRLIAQKIQSLTEPADISAVMTDVENLLDNSIAPAGRFGSRASRGYIIEAPADYQTDPLVDLSLLDFDQLRERFKTQHKQLETEKLRGSIRRKLSDMIRVNKTRLDYQAKFEQLIADYNEAALNVDAFFEQLIALARELNAEDQRTIAENLTDEELTVFDLLTKPEPDLTESERNAVKAVAKTLLETLKREKLVLDWRKQQRLRAAVRLTVEQVLDDGLPDCYTEELFYQKSERVYQHVYDSYYGAGSSIYSVAA